MLKSSNSTTINILCRSSNNAVQSQQLFAIFSDITFVFYILTSFLCERTIIGRVSLAFFVATGFFCFLFQKNKRANFFFLFEAAFILFAVIQIKSGISLTVAASSEMIETCVICAISYFSLFNYILFRKQYFKTLKIYLYSNIIALAINFLFDFDQLFKGRFGSGDGIVLLGQKIGGVTAISVGWIAGIMLSIVFIINIIDKKNNRYWLMSLFLILTIFLSGTRKALIFVLAFLILNIFVSRKERNKNVIIKLIAGILAISIVYFSLMTIPVLYNSIGIRLEAFIDYSSKSGSGDQSIITRDRLIDAAIDAFKLRPWYGSGLASFSSLYNNNEYYAHNNFLELLVGVGVVGTIIYYSKYLYLLAGLFKISRLCKHLINKIAIVFIIFMVFAIIAEYWQVTYFTRKFINFYIFIYAFLVIAKEKTIENENSVHRT